MTDPTPPLDGLLVLDISQFLSGPYAALRLGDLGARVIKVERPNGGDLCRQLHLSDDEIGGDSTLFHAINRGKESLALDLKKPSDVDKLKRLICRADVFIQNFRPGVIERLGLGYETVRALNPRLVYASITGYGGEGPWVQRPGQDLLAQARSGVMWLSGDEGQGPVPIGVAVADLLAGTAIVQGVLAALVRRGTTGTGANVETSLLEVLVDLQFEVLTTHLNDGGRAPMRASFNSAHAYLAAPYGVYRATDGHLALSMTPIARLADLLRLHSLDRFRNDPKSWFTERDAIKKLIADRIATDTVTHWLSILEPADIWCAKVLAWPELLASDGFKALDMLQTLERTDGVHIETTRAPIRIDGIRARSRAAAPRIGEHSDAIGAEFEL